jgi:RNA polymerase sigma-70 factor (ECF subfamily)
MIALASPASVATARPRSPAFHNDAPCPDNELLARLQTGDRAAFEDVVHEHGGRVLAVARRFLRCEEDVADAVQETFLRAFASIRSFQGAASLSTWLHRIAVNVCLMKLRDRPGRQTLSLDELLLSCNESSHHPQPAELNAPAARWLEREETRVQVRTCIDRLPQDHRTILLLRDIEELDTDQTAQTLGLSRSAVKTRLHRARHALRELLSPLVEEDFERV